MITYLLVIKCCKIKCEYTYPKYTRSVIFGGLCVNEEYM